METTPTDIEYHLPQRPPWRNVMLLLGLVLVGMAVGNLLAMMTIMTLSMTHQSIGLEDIAQMIQTPEAYPRAWWYLMILQVISHVFTFLVPGLVYWRWSEKHRIENFVRRSFPTLPILLLVLLVVLIFMPFNSWVIEWNSSFQLPKALSRVEEWMLRKEDELSVMTHFLTNFSTFPKLFLAIIVIAFVPAVGEEVLFRGIIQRKIFHKISEMHTSIWITAALFSAIHLQFYGFIPRMLLGGMFGYLYVWTRNLWTPIFAHFVNNAATVLIVFLSNRHLIDIDIEKSTSSVSWIGALFSLLVTAVLLGYLKLISQRSSSIAHGT